MFHEQGEWRIAVESGFGDSRLTYGPVSITSSPRAGAPGTFPTTWLVVLLSAAALASVLVLGTRRLRRLAPAGR